VDAIAAIGGAILSFSLFLTISFHASPYFTGADIVFFFAWMPFIVAGGGTRFSVDAWIAKYVAKKEGTASPELRGHSLRSRCNESVATTTTDTCAAREGLACDKRSVRCCWAIVRRWSRASTIDSVDRRALVVGGVVAASVGAAALIFGGAVADTGKMIGGVKTAKRHDATDAAGRRLTHDDRAVDRPTHAGHPRARCSARRRTCPPARRHLHHSHLGRPRHRHPRRRRTSSPTTRSVPHAGCTVGYYARQQHHPLSVPRFGVQRHDRRRHRGPAPHGLLKLNDR
jgi:hypothetical protein